MIDCAVRQLLRVRRLDAAELRAQQALIADLAATLCVERGLVEDDTGLFAVMDLVDELAILPDSDDLGFLRLRVLPELGHIDAGKVRHRNARIRRTGRARAAALLLHCLLEAVLIEIDAVFMQDLFRELPRETERIVEAETNGARQFLLASGLELLNLSIEELHALIERRRKAILLDADDFLDIVLFRDELTEVARLAVNLDNGIHRALEELVLDAEHAAVADGTAQDAAQHIAAALI